MHFYPYIFLSIAFVANINAGLLPARDISIPESDLIKRTLESRDLPPCKLCKGETPGKGDDDLDKREIDPAVLEEAKRSLESRDVYDENYIPPLCNEKAVNCMYLGVNVTYIKGGLKPHIGYWYRRDGSQIYAWDYWQSTLLFTGPGGSAITYPAHCTVYTCAKGLMFAHVYDEDLDIYGREENPNKNVCHCSYDLDTDQYFGLYKPV